MSIDNKDAAASYAAHVAGQGNGWRRMKAFCAQHLRYEVIALIFVVMTVNQADRATMSIASAPMSSELHLDHVQMGWLFSSFAWAYMVFQMAGGWALDRFGAKPTYTIAIFVWSTVTGLIGLTPLLGEHSATVAIFALVFLIGVAAAPSFPANSKIVAAWFPTRERGTASAIFNATQYFAAAVFTPFLAWIAVQWNWRGIYYVMGIGGLLVGLVFALRLKAPLDHPKLSSFERQALEEGGATLAMGPAATVLSSDLRPRGVQWARVRQLLSNRMLVGIYFGQYCISTLTFFFLTWFPVYLVQQRHIPLLKAGLIASVPALCGFVGGIWGGYMSDALLRSGKSLTYSRKLPIYVGMLLSSLIIACNYVSADWMVVIFMAVAFFGKGMGALGWAVVADTSPVNAAGLNAAVFNTFSSAAGITTPIAIGMLVQRMHSFNGALMFVGVHALLAIVCYAVVVGRIQRVQPL